jgi:O-antigen ligase
MVPPADVWRAVRWCAIASIVTAPLFTEDVTRRWSALSGGPNELGLLAAALIVLSLAGTGGRWRVVQILIGCFGLAVTTSVSAGVAVIAGVLLVQPGVRTRLRRALPGGSLLKVAFVASVLAILAARPDVLTTLAVHRDQAAATFGILDATNPILGGGWLHGAEVIATGSLNTAYSSVFYDTVHNLYLQLLTDTGLVGLGLFAAALYSVWRRADRTNQALLAVCAIWLNTTAAYPSVVWGLLGLLIAVPTGSTRCESRE